MIIKNKKSGLEFEVARDFFENAIVAKGNGDMYDIVEDEAPLEVKRLREEVVEIKRKQSKPSKAETNKKNGN